MRSFNVVLALLVASARLDAAQAPYQATWWDAASVSAAAGVALVPVVLALPKGPPSCAPCDPGSVPGIDHVALHAFSNGAGTASSLLLAGVVGTAGLASLRALPPAQARGNAAVFLNSLAWTEAATEWIKVAVRRNRPILYTAGAAAASGDRENQQSFPSGHASVAFAAATSYLLMADRQHLPHRTRNAIVLYTGATAVAALRVAAGKHFPTDVAGGALLGSGIAWLVARIHPTAP
jgi:membrane-associated phospholipid phosphatase